jgi:hypothetical protein
MKRLWMAVAIVALGCGSAFAQVGGVSVPTPGIATTSPLGMSGGSQSGTSVGPTGIPLGATELTSPGISPMLIDPTAMMSSGATCAAGASASTGISGGISGVSTYDGGGLAVGSAMGAGTALPGSAAPCVAAGITSSSASAPSTSPGAAFRSGIPLGSVEIGSAGVSPLITLPAPSVSSSPMGTFGSTPSILGAPTLPSTSVPLSSPTQGTGIATNQGSTP